MLAGKVYSGRLVRPALFGGSPEWTAGVRRHPTAVVATAVVLTADFADGITEIGIGQPGGTLEVGVQRTDGAVTGLSIGGAVRLTQTLTVTLPGPAAAPC